MKRQQFRLDSVLRFYDVRKKRAELDLRDASQKLRQWDATIAELDREMEATAAALQSETANLNFASWLACYRKTDHLKSRRNLAQKDRDRQAAVVKDLERIRIQWSIKEEALRSLKQSTDAFNRDQMAKTQQDQLDETVMRQWIEHQQELEHNC